MVDFTGRIGNSVCFKFPLKFGEQSLCILFAGVSSLTASVFLWTGCSRCSYLYVSHGDWATLRCYYLALSRACLL